MTAPRDARATAARVDLLLAQLRSGADPRAALVAEELVGCLVRLYGAGLERIAGAVGRDRTLDLCTDPLVESLMLVHDLHPLDADTRVRRALDRAGAFADGVRFDGIDADGVARVRLAGGGRGCRSSARASIEATVHDAAPDVTGVVVEVDAAPPPLLSISRRPGLGAA